VDTDTVTVKEFRDEILCKAMNMMNPDVMLDGKGVIVISSEEGETECNEPKLLKEMSIVDGCILKVDDFFQNYELTVTIIHKAAERDEPKFQIIGDKDALKPTETAEELKKKQQQEEPQPGPSGSGSNGGSSNGSRPPPPKYESDDDDCMEVEIVQSSAEKRKKQDNDADDDDDDDDSSPTRKRARVEPQVTQELLVAAKEDDDDDDLICID